jgi:hypothetical protein
VCREVLRVSGELVESCAEPTDEEDNSDIICHTRMRHGAYAKLRAHRSFPGLLNPPKPSLRSFQPIIKELLNSVRDSPALRLLSHT